VYVVDLARDAPWSDFEMLRKELEAYRSGLTNRPSLIIANKADLTKRREFDEFEQRVKQILGSREDVHIDLKVVPISAMFKKNILKVTSLLRHAVEQMGLDEISQKT
jgi:GTP-binding protein